MGNQDHFYKVRFQLIPTNPTLAGIAESLAKNVHLGFVCFSTLDIVGVFTSFRQKKKKMMSLCFICIISSFLIYSLFSAEVFR